MSLLKLMECNHLGTELMGRGDKCLDLCCKGDICVCTVRVNWRSYFGGGFVS